MTSPGGPEPTAIDWNGPTARYWADHDDRYDALLAPHGEVLLAAAAPAPGERVLDVGCGCGSTTVRAARMVRPDGGRALGVDISRPMIDTARARAREAGVGNVEFRLGDMQTADVGRGAFDLVISRYGVMFFEDPTDAFANIRAAVRPGGRLAFVCWAERARNEYWSLPFAAMARHLGWPAPGSDTAGPFSLADPDHVRTILGRAGWVDVEVGQVRDPLRVGRDAEDAVAFETSDPSTAGDLATAAPAEAARAIEALRDAFAARERPDGVWVSAAAWLVCAIAG